MPELVTLPAALRDAAASWASRPVAARLAVVSGFRRRLARDAAAVAAAVPGRPAADTIAAEVLPMLEAARFLEREAAAILAPRRHGRRGRPAWLIGHRAVSERVPFGAVLVLAPSNYPFLLGGAQALQALAAGNAVALKPGCGGGPAAAAFASLLAGAGLPPGLLAVTGDGDDTGRALAGLDFDRIVLTGSAATGRAVLAAAAANLVPSTVELSGADPALVLDGADLGLVARCLAYGLRLNAGATCIAPRLVLVPRRDAAALERALLRRIAAIGEAAVAPAAAAGLARLAENCVARGARLAGGPAGGRMRPLVIADAPPDPALLSADLFAPWLAIVPVDGTEAAIALAASCRLRLGASVFGPARAARAAAHRLGSGAVTVNDVIVPTADPRLGFGGAGDSGFGATRGAEGLLEMTRLRTVSTRARLAPRPHLAPPGPRDAARLAGLALLLHGGGGTRGAALRALLAPGAAPAGGRAG